MPASSELFDILLARTSPKYHAAEVMRRQVGAQAMASSPRASEAYAAVRLLIGTWETIAHRVRANAELREAFFETNPVGHMWNALAPAVKIIRGAEHKGKGASYYAGEFEKLNRSYASWLRRQPPSYRTAALQGINAQFG